MSHANASTHIGTCATCGRENVELREARQKPGRYNCVDEFACFEQWQRNKGVRYPEPLDQRFVRGQ